MTASVQRAESAEAVLSPWRRLLHAAAWSLTGVALVGGVFLAVSLLYPVLLSEPPEDPRITAYNAAEWQMTTEPGAPVDASAWQKIALPDYQAAERVESPRFGLQPLSRPTHYHWYRFTVQRPEGMQGWALYMPRFEDRALVLVNGVEVQRTFLPDIIQHGWNVPLWVVTPPMVWQDGDNEILIRLDSPYIGVVLVSRLFVGPPELLQPVYRRAYALRINTAQISAWMLAGLGVFALGIWAMHRTDNALHLLLGLCALAFAARQLHYFVDQPVISLAFHWWLAVCSLAWAILFLFLFACRFYAFRYNWFQKLLVFGTVLVSLLILPGVGFDAYSTAGLVYTMLAPLGIGIGVVLIQRAWQQPGIAPLLMAIGFTLVVALGVYDFALMMRLISIEMPYLLPIGAALLLLCFSMALASRYVESLREVESLNTSLEARVLERQAALEETFEQLRKLNEEQTLAEERQRLMREIHDGIGANLVATLASVGQEAGSAWAGNALRRAIADLKLTIDSLEPVEGDLLSLLGNLRYRLAPQLRQAGIHIDWQVEPVPPLQWLRAPQALHVLRILQEAFSNVLQHAGATQVTVTTGPGYDERSGQPGIWISIEDNGTGLVVPAGDDDTAPRSGKGMANMRYRADALGGYLTVAPVTGGTRVRLWLPGEPLAPA
ncbi:sensor histidine kinase [Alcanivorax sp. JB21]|uniref:sensor histidine kinase n=1 Tax=Alcanivorax limicola TaxID=2874102 RepID=UPI001CBD8C5F|nr:sensor histidine kinase [Alcanivorax limicola]MBZ2188474.1 sensor histidine kinase [Alcanivorax limicola]